jgi:negative regulator of sigma E activity
MNRSAQERLMRYVDGEADAEEAELVERWLAESAEARAVLRDFEVIGGGLRAIADERGTRMGSIADSVMAQVAGEGPVSRTRVHATPIEAAKKGRKIVSAVPAIGLALAAAAVVLIYLRPHPGPAPAVRNELSASPVIEPLSSSSSEPGEVAVADPESGASIESVDFGAQNGTIFIVPSGPQSTPVVWLMDDAEPSSG